MLIFVFTEEIKIYIHTVIIIITIIIIIIVIIIIIIIIIMQLILWSGNFFLIVPFPGHCLLVPSYIQYNTQLFSRIICVTQNMRKSVRFSSDPTVTLNSEVT